MAVEPQVSGLPGAGEDQDDRSDDLFTDVLKSSIRSHQWSASNLTSKAKSSLAAGAVVLGIALTGIMGFSGLLGGDGVFLTLESLHPGVGYSVLLSALASLVLLSLSIHFSVRALRTVKIMIPVVYRVFTGTGKRSEEIDEDVLEAWESMSKKEMRRKINLAYIDEIKSLEKHADAMARDTGRGQRLLRLGLLSGVTASVIVLAAQLAAGAAPMP
ncbi:MAG: hypothetical protein OXU37_07090 [Thaumarchaeota archaeon]|nr:hypothetical protein [Nitrososphaerota archaeon]